MNKKFENIITINSRELFDQMSAYCDSLIDEATDNRMLQPDADNEYTREIGRIGNLCAQYENEYYPFEHITIRKKSPLIRSIEDAMYNLNIKQKELATMLEINEPSLSQIMRGKRPVTMRTAKRLYHSLKIDPRLIVEYA